ncbi:hypothetical protein MKX03_027278 [Papaver bracteatum]|nr:hypothetical protein MKX03_027278 [Papaver bracteatum]
MPWYRNPRLFLYCSRHRFFIYRIVQKYNVPIFSEDFENGEKLDFSRHLSLGNNQESDYDALKSWLNEGDRGNKYVNCQGLVIYWLSGRDCPGTWSRVEEDDYIFFSLPGIINPYEVKLAEKQADEQKISAGAVASVLKDKLNYEVTRLNSEVTYSQEQLNQEKNDRQAQVSDLTTKLEELSGARGGSAVVQPWTSGDTVSSHLVSFEDLYVTSSPKNTSVTIIEGSSTWSQVDEHDSIFYSLPGIKNPLTEKLLVEKNSELVAENSILKERLMNEVTNLQEQLIREKNAKQAFEKEVFDLTAKLEECRGAGSGSPDVQPWMSLDTVPSHWVPFEELDVLNLPKITPLTVMEKPSKPRFVEDATTNIFVNRFYRGTFIVAVNVAELSPDNEKARFDPEFWGLYKNADVTYAARKPLKLEMSVSPPKAG